MTRILFQLGFWSAAISMLSAGCAGLPAGTKASASGFMFEPFGSSPTAPKAVVGIYSYSTPDPSGSAPGINRVQIRSIFADHTSTNIHGRVGEEMQKAGDILPKTMNALHGEQATLPALPLPTLPSATPDARP